MLPFRKWLQNGYKAVTDIFYSHWSSWSLACCSTMYYFASNLQSNLAPLVARWICNKFLLFDYSISQLLTINIHPKYKKEYYHYCSVNVEYLFWVEHNVDTIWLKSCIGCHLLSSTGLKLPGFWLGLLQVEPSHLVWRCKVNCNVETSCWVHPGKLLGYVDHQPWRKPP